VASGQSPKANEKWKMEDGKSKRNCESPKKTCQVCISNYCYAMIKRLLSIVALFSITVGVYAAEFPDVSVADVKAAVASKSATVLDVNGTESYQAGHIPGAIDYVANKDNIASLLPKDKNAEIIAYCANSRCPAYRQAAVAAKKLGYKNIKHMTVGIAGWKDAGEKTEKGS
jgi:rhodanese-related sulfurtransferase